MVHQIINQLKFSFDEGLDVKGQLSIAALFPKSQKRCGIYLLQFSNDTFYIGQAIDAVKRFCQHRKNHDNIIRFWFQNIDKEQLDALEKLLIHQAESQGLLLTNKVHISQIIGETDLDQIIAPDLQFAWLEENATLSNDGFDLYKTIDIQHIVKYQSNFEKLKTFPEYPSVKQLLKIYIENCLPAFKKTEQTFWSLSCLPATNQHTFPRYFGLSINMMEVFVVGYNKKTKEPFCFLNTSQRFFDNDDEGIYFDSLFEKYPTLEYEESTYRAAGADQIQFHFQNFQECEQFLLSENNMIDSIKELNLRLMLKGSTNYAPFHCFDLVKDVLS